MFQLATSELTHDLPAYGYWEVLLGVAIERTGIPSPSQTMLLVAAISAGTTHRLSLPLVIAAAASGAILGDNLGFWLGREGGYRLLRGSGHS
jgi:membrane protein DedA with SNARE-associated domain